MKTALIVFAKAPETAKTRLAAACGRHAATQIAAALLDDTLDRATRSGLAPRWLYWNGPDTHAAARATGTCGWRLARQSGADLGERMGAALDAVLRESERAILIGTDCPDLDAARITQAAAVLDEADGVLVPATDGGYVLIGVRRSVRPHLTRLLSGIRWSTNRVAAETRGRFRACGLSFGELPALSDLDDWNALERLALVHPFIAQLKGRFPPRR